MKAINPLLVVLICLFGRSAMAQKMVTHSFRYQGDTSGHGQLRFLTQVTQPNTTFLRLYFTGTQLGDGSYLVLEGTDGARQELRKPDLDNWHYSSAYFNGQSVNVSLFAAAGERNTVCVSGVKVTNPQAVQARNARQATGNFGTTTRAVASTSANLTETHPHAKAVGRFTNGSTWYGAGWIAPNGVIVTSSNVFTNSDPNEDKIIEFNVPPSVGGTPVHSSPQDQYPLNISKPNRDGLFTFKEEPKGPHGYYIGDYGWWVIEPLPNSITGLRPGERQQEYFRVALNPGNFTIDSKGDGGIPVDIFHYGAYSGGLEGADDLTTRTLQLMETSLLRQNEFISVVTPDRDRFVLYGTPLSLHSAKGAPITFRGSNVAIGVHHQERFILEGVDMPGYGLGFRDNGFREEVGRFYTERSAYLDLDGASDQPNGQVHKPYLTVQQAAQHAPNDYTLYIAKGTYSGAVTFNRPLTLRAPVGTVRIGASPVGARQAAMPTIAQEMALAEVLSTHSRLENPETTEKVRAYPNPFRGQTEIRHPFTEGGPASVSIFNTAGVLIATFNSNNGTTDQNGVQWNGTDQNGQPVPTGLYLIRVNDGRQTFTTKVLKQ
ncbi:T9SS C-terminal target domain-containing protein [Fibrisoma montanum]|uniref:T9SS C-terminal target domain-containing protein n=1 Tax=Fibrisoma montanum TaxID=2305895 RepID=A0A418M2T5_9BACT|nr:T9SS type A sorting domain-containing protein [Fibrisoma montanum]RIV19955.1 T9SS C-terminal target domain-containing protein [Fibrisoma montanum]